MYTIPHPHHRYAKSSYEIGKKFEAGISLVGTEIVSFWGLLGCVAGVGDVRRDEAGSRLGTMNDYGGTYHQPIQRMVGHA